MKIGKQILWVMDLIGILLVAAACGPAQAEPTPSALVAVPALPTASAVAEQQGPAVSEVTAATTPDSVAGRYRLKPPKYEEDYDQVIEEDYYLVQKVGMPPTRL